MPLASYTCLSMVYFLCSVIGSFGNTITIYSIVNEMNLTPTIVINDLFLLSMAIADLMVSFIGQPLIGFYLVISSTAGHKEIIRCIFSILIGFSLTSLYLMTGERVMKITVPNKHDEWLEEKRIKFIVGLTWTLQILFQTTSFYSQAIFTGFNVLNSFGTLICLIVSYVLILRKYKSSKNVILRLQANESTPSTNHEESEQISKKDILPQQLIDNIPPINHKNEQATEDSSSKTTSTDGPKSTPSLNHIKVQKTREEKKLSKRVLSILSVHFLSIIGSIPIMISKSITGKENLTLFIVALILSCNSTIDPFLYILSVEKFQRRARQFFGKRSVVPIEQPRTRTGKMHRFNKVGFLTEKAKATPVSSAQICEPSMLLF